MLSFSRKTLIVTLVIGTCMFIICLTVALVWPIIMQALLTAVLPIQPGTFAYKMWQDFPVPVITKFYYFNLTNPHDFVYNGAKPHFEELGPYVYPMTREKVEMTWTSHHTVKFYQNSTWYFDPIRSNGSVSDVVTTLNPLAYIASNIVRDHKYMSDAINGLVTLYNITPVITHTVDEWTFSGYDDPLLDILNDLNIKLTSFALNKFAWFMSRNGSATYDGYYQMHTGTDDIAKVCSLIEWNNSSQSHAFSSYCGWINGSLGELYSMGYDSQYLNVFEPDACRTLNLKYKEDLTLNGVVAQRFHGPAEMFQNSSTNPDNWCFETTGKEYPSGVLDMSTCKFHAPALASYPHFLYADPVYMSMIDGVSEATEADHMSYYDLEPRTGVPVQALGRIQLNLIVAPIPGIRIFENLPEVTAFPMLWYEMGAILPDNLHRLLRIALHLSTVGIAIFYALTGIGIIMVLSVIILYIRDRRLNIYGKGSSHT